VRDVLTRPKIVAKFPHLTPDRVELFVQKLASISVLVTDVPDAGIPLRDPDDLPYLNLAVAVNATHLVSRDKDLLDLGSDPAFVAEYLRLRIVDPVEFLKVATETPAQ
jgi:putative PIN family toxin of toxin-antitoxin system